MWKPIRSWYDAIGSIQSKLKKTVENPVVGILMWVIFVSQLTPPGTSALKSAFLVVIGMFGIHGIATLMRNSTTKSPGKGDCEEGIEK